MLEGLRAVPPHIQVQDLIPIQSSPYGEGHSMELQAPVLDQLRAVPGNSSAQVIFRQPQMTKRFRPSLSETSRNQNQTKAEAQVTKVVPAELGKAKHVQRRRMRLSLQQTNFPSPSITQDGKKPTSTHADQRQQMRTKFPISKSRLPASGSTVTKT